MSRFPVILTALRKERKLSQKVVALDLNISQALLSHYEKGVRECSLDLLITIANYYGVSCDYLLGCSDVRTKATDTSSNIETLKGCMSGIIDSVVSTDDQKLIDAVEKYLTLSMYNLIASFNVGKAPRNRQKLHLSLEISEMMQKNQLYKISRLSGSPLKQQEPSDPIASTLEMSEKYFSEFIEGLRL